MDNSSNGKGCAKNFLFGSLGCSILSIAFIPMMCFFFTIIALIGSEELYSEGYLSEVIEEGNASEQIVVITLDGVIVDSDDGLHQNTIIEYITSALDSANEDPNVKAVIMKLDTPGGSVYDSAVISNKIAELQANNKPVVSVIESMAASGGYWVASGTDYIFISPESLTGSIGVLFQSLEYDELLNKIGLNEIIITNSEGVNKVPTDLENSDNPQQKIYKDLLDENFEEFLTRIIDGRGLTREEVIKFADGRLISGKTAVDIKFADELGGFDEAVEYIKTQKEIDNPQIVEYQWVELVGWGGFSAKVNNILTIKENFGQSGSGVMALPDYYFSPNE